MGRWPTCFGIGNDQKKKLEENKFNVNLTKIVNDPENIPTSDTSSNMLDLFVGHVDWLGRTLII